MADSTPDGGLSDSRRVRFSGKNQFSATPEMPGASTGPPPSSEAGGGGPGQAETGMEVAPGTHVWVSPAGTPGGAFEGVVVGPSVRGGYAVQDDESGRLHEGVLNAEVLVTADPLDLGDALLVGDRVQVTATAPALAPLPHLASAALHGWLDGRVTSVHRQGAGGVVYDVAVQAAPGTVLTSVASSDLRVLVRPADLAVHGDHEGGSSPEEGGGRLTVGARAERWSKQKGSWVPGTVTGVVEEAVPGSHPGVFQFTSDAGKVRNNVPGDQIRLPDDSPPPPQPSALPAGADGYGADAAAKLTEGSRVTAAFRGAGPAVPATVSQVGSSAAGAVYSLAYDDGREEEGVPEHGVNGVTAGGASAVRQGDRIQMPPRAGHGAAWGTVTRLHPDGSSLAGCVDVRFDSGVAGRGLPLHSAVAALDGQWEQGGGGGGGAAPPPSHPSFVVGDRVEAQFQGVGEVLGATVAAVDSPPSDLLTLHFDSGATERDVPPEDVVPAATGSAGVGCREGDYVMAPPRPKRPDAKAAAIITRLRRQGAVDLRFVRSGVVRPATPQAALAAVRAPKELERTDAAWGAVFLPGALVFVPYKGREAKAEVVAPAGAEGVEVLVRRKRRVVPLADVQLDPAASQPAAVSTALEMLECPFADGIPPPGCVLPGGDDVAGGDSDGDSDASWGAGSDDDSDASWGEVYGRDGSHPDAPAPSRDVLSSTFSMLLGTRGGGGVASGGQGGLGDTMTPLPQGGASMLAPSVLAHLANTRLRGDPEELEGEGQNSGGASDPPARDTQALAHYEPPADPSAHRQGRLMLAGPYAPWKHSPSGALVGRGGAGGGLGAFAPLGRYVGRQQRTRLARYGFSDALGAEADGPGGAQGGALRVVLDGAVTPGTEPPIDLDVELSDALDCHDIELQFATVQPMPAPPGEAAWSPPPSVFFTFSFWTVGGIRTRPLACVPDAATATAGAGPLHVLMPPQLAAQVEHGTHMSRRPTARDHSRLVAGAGGGKAVDEGPSAAESKGGMGGGDSDSKSGAPPPSGLASWSGDVRASLAGRRVGQGSAQGAEVQVDAALMGAVPTPPAVRLRVDPGLAGQRGGVRAFLEYLAEKFLHVEMWDAASQLPLGHLSVPLSPLLRRQRRSRTVIRSYPLLPYNSPTHSSAPGAVGTPAPGTLAATATHIRVPEVSGGHASHLPRGQGGGVTMGAWGMGGDVAPLAEVSVIFKNTGRRGAVPEQVAFVEQGGSQGLLAAQLPPPSREVGGGTGRRAGRVRVTARPIGAGDASVTRLLAARGAGRSGGGKVSVRAARRGEGEGRAEGGLTPPQTEHEGGSDMSSPSTLSSAECSVLQRIFSSAEWADAVAGGADVLPMSAKFVADDFVAWITGQATPMLGPPSADPDTDSTLTPAASATAALATGSGPPTVEVLVARAILGEAHRAAVASGLPEGVDAPEAALTPARSQRGSLLYTPFRAAEAYVAGKVSHSRAAASRAALGSRHLRRADVEGDDDALADATDPTMEAPALTAGEGEVPLEPGEMILGRVRWVLARDLRTRLTDAEFDRLVDRWEAGQRRAGRAGPSRRATGAAADKRELLVVPWRAFVDDVLDTALEAAKAAREGGEEESPLRGAGDGPAGHSGVTPGGWAIVVAREFGGQLPPAAVVARGKILRALSYVGRGGGVGPAHFLRSMLSTVDFTRDGRVSWEDAAAATAEFLNLRMCLPGAPVTATSHELGVTITGASAEGDLVSSEYGAALAARQLRRGQVAEGDTRAIVGPRGVLRSSFGGVPSSARAEQLQLLQMYREGRKHALVGSLLQAAVTSVYHLHVRFGVASLLLHTLENPFPAPLRLHVGVEDPFSELRLVSDAAELAFLLKVLQPEAADQGAAALAARGVQGGGGCAARPLPLTPEGDLVVGPRERITVPLLFLSFAGGATPPTREAVILAGKDTLTDPSIAEESAGAYEEGVGGGGASATPTPRSTTAYTALALTAGELRRMRLLEEGAGRSSQRSGRGQWQAPIQPRTIPVHITNADSGTQLALLKVVLRPRPAPVHRVLRFFVPEGEYMSADLLLPNSRSVGPLVRPGGSTAPVSTRSSSALAATGAAALPGQYVHCADSEATIECRDTSAGRVATVRYRAGLFPSAHDFHVLLYNDPYAASLHEAWHVIVHPLSNQHLVTTLGQTARVEIGIRGGRRQREATVFVSDPSKLRLVSGPNVHLVPGATNAVSMTYRAATAGSEALQVHIVDRHTHELISAWRLTATTNMPRIARSYTLTVPVGRPVRRKLEYTNRWPNQRVFAVTSNAPHILSTREPDALALEGSATGFIGLTVHAVRTPRLEEVLLFVNDEEDVNVETLLVRVKYVPSAYVGL